MTHELTLGATALGGGRWRSVVWAPKAQRVDLRIGDTTLPMQRDAGGYHRIELRDVAAGAGYAFSLDGGPERPDPASRWQPDGVHGWSALVDPAAFTWTDAAFTAPAQRDLVIYELHVGTFTREGTFDAAIGHFAELRELGVNALEPLPIAQFPGARNWGYDGTLPWAAQNTYGGPEGFRRFVDAAHAAGLAVLLDVVYNHLGPEGNYLGEFGPYTTERYQTPWGGAMNFDGPESDDVRRLFIESALMWVRECHVDGFRVDAVHAIVDASARPFLAELTDAVHAEAARLDRAAIVIAESDQNDSRVITETARGGLGFDATWSDDFHHSVHTLLTGETNGYYGDFGGTEHLAETLRRGWAYAGRYSGYRRRRHGNEPHGAQPDRFVVAVQNHDQVGNRARGERLATLVDLERLKVAAAALLLSPFVPMLFMGEEYGEERPFLYFTSHSDAALIEAVRNGRREEFSGFGWQGEVPDPQSGDTFLASTLDRSGGREEIRRLYRELLRLRSEHPDLRASLPAAAEVIADAGVVALLRERLAVVLAFAPGRITLPPRHWTALLDTAQRRFGGPASDDPAEHTAAVELRGPRALLLVRHAGSPPT